MANLSPTLPRSELKRFGQAGREFESVVSHRLRRLKCRGKVRSGIRNGFAVIDHLLALFLMRHAAHFACRLAPERLNNLIDDSEFTVLKNTPVGISERNQAMKCQTKIFVDPEFGRSLFDQLVPNLTKSSRGWSIRQLLTFNARDRTTTGSNGDELLKEEDLVDLGRPASRIRLNFLGDIEDKFGEFVLVGGLRLVHVGSHHPHTDSCR